MNKPRARVTGIVVNVLFAAVAMTGALADDNHNHHAAEPGFTAPLPSPTPPAKKDRVVGTCNTAEGCEALKATCKSLKKHSFKETDADGNLGVCIDLSAAQPNFYLKNTNVPKVPDPSYYVTVGEWDAACALSASRRNSEPTVCCQGVALCTKLKNGCKGLKGKYTPSTGHSGWCSH